MIDIYDRLFSVQQALELEGSDRPLEVVIGMGVARWRQRRSGSDRVTKK
jgi:hypothetical protein